MTKKDLAKAIAEEMGLTQIQVKAIIQRVFTGITETLLHEGRLELRNFGVFDSIVGTLAGQGRIELRNFGVFAVKRRKPRKARNPRTGQAVEVPAKLVVTFKPGQVMAERVGALKSEAPEADAGA